MYSSGEKLDKISHWMSNHSLNFALLCALKCLVDACCKVVHECCLILWESEDWLEVKCSADVELDLTIDQEEVVMPVHTLMDCKWLAGIMTKWKQTASYPWALSSTWMMKEQLFWTNKAYLSKCGMQSSPIFPFFKWGLACVAICFDCYWLRAPSSTWTGALFILNNIVEAWYVWTDSFA